MSGLHRYPFPLLALVVLWVLSCPGWGVSAWPGADGRGVHSKDHLDPNTRDWGDYSDLQGLGHGLGLEVDREEEEQDREESSSSLYPELDFLSDFAGKKRLWVITAPSHNDHYLRMMEKQLEDMEQEGLNCRLAERDTYIVTIIQNAMMEGRIQKTTAQGEATVETLSPDTVSKLLHHLELTNQDGEFSMLVLKKNLRVGERFPYPVRVDAILEMIDQLPVRKLEKMTRRGSALRCKVVKKRVLVKKRKTTTRKTALGALRRGNVTSVVPARRPPVDRKAALKSKIQEILMGRSSYRPPEASAGGKARGGKPDEKTPPPKKSSAGKDKSSSKKKGKGKKGKKGKGRGRKSDRERSTEDTAALGELLEALRGKRRLMVISSPNKDAALYVQLQEDNQKQHCDFALRKITLATMLGQGRDTTLTLHHYQLDSEAPFNGLADGLQEAGLVSLLRAELGLSSADLFSMTVTDLDLKRNRVFEAPPSTAELLRYVDGFASRRPERERERKGSAACSADRSSAGESVLLRFLSKRRLLLVSTPAEDDYSYQQQLSALTGQDCPLGIRHFALLKLIGTGAQAKGTVELFPLNGRSQIQTDPLSRAAVNDIREQLKVSTDYFSMLVVGKDGDVKAWFPSPMWSLDNIYDLVDSLDLRVQEARLQTSLGISCPEDRGGGGGGGGDGG